METEAKITALAPWFGAKRNLAPEIVRELGPHRVYWEPFCGSMAVLLAKPSCVMETVNDLHGDLVNLARTVRHSQAGPRLYRRLRRTLMAEELFEEAAEHIRDDCVDFGPATEDFDERRAYLFFITTWLGRNGVAGTATYNSNFCARYTANGGHAATRWNSAIASIPAWRRRLSNVTIMRRGAFELLPRIYDQDDTAIYVDPPYLVKGSKYAHDFAPEDHGRLAESLHRFTRARVVVSYYDHPDLDGLYPGWTKRKIVVSKALVAQGRRDKGNNVKAVECLLINGPSLVKGEGLFGAE